MAIQLRYWHNAEKVEHSYITVDADDMHFAFWACFCGAASDRSQTIYDLMRAGF